MEYSSIDRTIAQARGFAGPAEMHAYFERHGYPGQKSAKKGMSEAERHAYDLEIARKYQAEMRDEAQAPAHAPTLRSDILAAELRTARTKAERRDAVRRFEAAQRTPDEGRFVSWLASMGHETRYGRVR